MTADTPVRIEDNGAGHADVRVGDILAIVQKHERDGGALIAILESIQAEYGYLPERALRIVSESTRRSLVDVFGVATFYRSFSLCPRGKHLICACQGTACHVRGGPVIVEEFQRQLGIDPGETTSDKAFTLETVNCLGSCALGPVVVIDGHYFSKVRKSEVRQMIDRAREGMENAEIEEDKRIFPLEVSCPRCNHSLMDQRFPIDGCASIRITGFFDHRHSWLRLSSLYGSHHLLAQHDISPDTVLRLFCPHCHRELAGSRRCHTCGAAMAPMPVHGGGILQICSRRGCRNRTLDLV